jgi:3-hydroxybutyrate dehydrogenase
MLKGRNAVVTGSTSGIGLAIARGLAQAGCNIMLNGLGEPKAIEQLRSELASECSVKVLFNGADMTKPSEIADLIDSTAKSLGSVDILVNNAGIQHTSPLETFPTDKWDSIIAINLSSAFHTTKHALPYMRTGNWGRIVNIASVHGLVASVDKAAYVAAKHGIIGLTKVTALETAESGITCNAICPGWVRTALVEAQIDSLAKKLNIKKEEAAVNLLSEKQPSKQFVETSAIGALCVFLCGEAANQITGASMPIDGGWVAR